MPITDLYYPMTKNRIMNRREALKQGFIVIGGTVVSGAAVSSMLVGCQADARAALNWVPEALTAEQASIITKAIDTIIPKTDTPGAVEAGVPQLFDLFVKDDIFTDEDKQKMMDGLAALDIQAQEKYGKSFANLSDEEAFEHLSALDKNFVEGKDEDGFFGDLKNFTVFAFANSELGGTQHLQYDAVPGGYSGCVPIEEIGVTWVGK